MAGATTLVSRLPNRFHHRYAHLIAIVALALIVRLAAFPDVVVNGDTGLYLYDAKQLLWGRQLFIDFPSRSPVFQYALAGAIALGDSPIIAARTLMLAISLGLGLAVYVFTRRLHTHASAIVALVIFYFSPFVISWGLWVKTEQAAGLVLLTAFIIALGRIDSDQLPLQVAAGLGILFGIAFLIRRVAIVHIGAFALFVVWYRYRQHGDLAATLPAVVVTVVGMLATLATTYLILGSGDPWMAWRIADTHAVALFASDGQGSSGWITVTDMRPETAQTGGLFAQLCQKCGLNTIEVFSQTILSVLPLVLPLFVLLRSVLRNSAEFWGDWAMPTAFLVVGAFAIYTAGFDHVPRMVAGASWMAAVVFVWGVEPVPVEKLWTPRLALPITVLTGLTAGYLYRDRILYVTYFQDFMPYLVPLAAVCLVALYRANSFTGRREVAVGLAILVLATGVAGANAVPYQPGGVDENSAWFTIELAHEYGADIDARTEPGDTVFAAQPLYVIESDRRLAADLSRKYYLFEGWPDDAQTDRVRQQLVADFESSRATIAIVDDEAYTVLADSKVRTAFQENYCWQRDGLYQETGGELHYHRDKSDGDCLPIVGQRLANNGV